jgi:hypothetical protein
MYSQSIGQPIESAGKFTEIFQCHGFGIRVALSTAKQKKFTGHVASVSMTRVNLMQRAKRYRDKIQVV